MPQAKFTVDQRQYAKLTGQALLICACDGVDADELTGRYEFSGPIDISKARLAFFFVAALFNDKSPTESFRLGLKASKTVPLPKEEAKRIGVKAGRLRSQNGQAVLPKRKGRKRKTGTGG